MSNSCLVESVQIPDFPGLKKEDNLTLCLPYLEQGGKGLVLGGGGAKGCYHVGVLSALNQLGKTFDALSGTSIGALVGFFYVQNEMKGLTDFVMEMEPTNVVRDLPYLPGTLKEVVIHAPSILEFIVKNYQDRMDITPLRQKFQSLFDFDAFMKAPMGYGCMTFNDTKQEGRAFFKKDFTKELCEDIVMASASCYPAFPKVNLLDEVYMDGGYAENVPLSVLEQMLPHPESVIIVDIHDPNEPMKIEVKENMVYLHPLLHPGKPLDFSREHAISLYRQGYLETMKKFNKMTGYLYTFPKENWSHIQVMERYMQAQFDLNKIILPDSEGIAFESICAMLGYVPRLLENEFQEEYEYGLFIEALGFMAKVDPYALQDYQDFLWNLKDHLDDLKLTGTDDRDFKAVEVLSHLKRDQLTILLHKYIVKNNGTLPKYIEGIKDKIAVSYTLAWTWYFVEKLLEQMPRNKESQSPESSLQN